MGQTQSVDIKVTNSKTLFSASMLFVFCFFIVRFLFFPYSLIKHEHWLVKKVRQMIKLIVIHKLINISFRGFRRKKNPP